MARLVTKDAVNVIEFAPQGRMHWLVGRSPFCDLVLADAGVSRFHATLFRWHREIFVLDHSLNGTYLCQDAAPLAPTTRLQTVTGQDLRTLSTQLETAPPPSDTIRLQPVLSFAEEKLPEMEEDEEDASSKSRVAFRLEQMDARLPRMAGYHPHEWTEFEQIRSLLEMVYSAELVRNLIGMARPLRDGLSLVFIGKKRYECLFEA